MKIKKGDWLIDTKSLFRIEWKKFYPTIHIHEKYENIVKWTTRIFTFIGIAISVISMPWYLSLLTSILLFSIDFLLEKVIFLFTTIVIQEFPNFEIKNGLWKGNLYLYPKYEDDLPIFCLGFSDKEYAEKLFDYFLSWNHNGHDDKNDIITINWTINKDNSYMTEISANPQRESLNQLFEAMGNHSKLIKYGKKQQQFVAQIAFRKEIDTSTKLRQFINQVKLGDKFYVAPALVTETGEELIELLHKKAILKYSYNLKNNYCG